MFAKTLLAAMFCTASLMATETNGARPVGGVWELEGQVTVKPPQGEAREARVWQPVYDGEQLVVANGARVVLSFRKDGHVEQIEAVDGEVQVTVTRSGCQPTTAVTSISLPTDRREVLASEIKRVKFGKGGVTALRGGDEDAAPQLTPIPGSTIVTSQPVFGWPAVAGAKEYHLVVEKGEDPQWKVTSPDTSITYAGLDLQPEIQYNWHVSARTASSRGAWEKGVVFSGKFLIASEDEQDVCQALLALAASDQIALRAVAAALLDRRGFAGEALTAYEQLAKQAPQCAEYHAALADLYARGGQTTKSQAARRQAESLGYEFAATEDSP